MPKKKETTITPDESILISAAKAIGTAAGKIAHLAGVAPEASAPAKSQKIARLVKKGKHRVPRLQKKALQKSSK
jgi:hypothetical protein